MSECGKHRIVVSAENNAFMAWQAKLFHFSCVSRLGQQPIIIVHDSGRDWHPDFYDLIKAGALVRGAPSYFHRNQTRNTVGTLLHAARLCRSDEMLVLCDPDMVFVRKPHFGHELSGNYYSYLCYDRADVFAAAEKLGVSREALMENADKLCCGVPYVIPARDALALGPVWLQAFDSFAERDWGDMWLDVMYAFGIAAVKLGWNVTLTDIVDQDDVPDARLRREVIHYCYGDTAWNKQQFASHDHAKRVWHSTFEAAPGTIRHEVFTQIRQAQDFYRDRYFQQRLVKPPVLISSGLEEAHTAR